MVLEPHGTGSSRLNLRPRRHSLKRHVHGFDPRFPPIVFEYIGKLSADSREIRCLTDMGSHTLTKRKIALGLCKDEHNIELSLETVLLDTVINQRGIITRNLPSTEESELARIIIEELRKGKIM